MATILVIDDEQSIRGLLKEVLVKAGHRVLKQRMDEKDSHSTRKNRSTL